MDPHDLRLIVSNIGNIAGFSAIYTSNSAYPHRFRSGQLKR